MQPTFEAADVKLYLGDARLVLPQLFLRGLAVVVTDPPYGIGLDLHLGPHNGETIEGDEDTRVRDEVLAMLRLWPALVFGSWRSPRPAGTRHVLTWAKGDHTGMGDLSLPWRRNTEEVYVLGEGWVGRRRSSVVAWPAVTGTVAIHNGRHHPTEKPVGLVLDLLQHAPTGGVLDPFMGSGTTGIACWRLGRPFVGIEVSPRHFDAARRRIEQAMAAEPLFHGGVHAGA